MIPESCVTQKWVLNQVPLKVFSSCSLRQFFLAAPFGFLINDLNLHKDFCKAVDIVYYTLVYYTYYIQY